jgi:altronate dehydratase small subunit
MAIEAIMIKEQDNVATALREINPEQEVVVGLNDRQIRITAKEHIPFGHKLAVVNIAKGEDIIKYGEVIGRATQDIMAGAYSHIHNIESLRGRGDFEKEEV